MQTDNAAENVQAAEEQELQPAEETKKGKEKKPVNVKKEILSWILTLGAAWAVDAAERKWKGKKVAG